MKVEDLVVGKKYVTNQGVGFYYEKGDVLTCIAMVCLDDGASLPWFLNDRTGEEVACSVDYLEPLKSTTEDTELPNNHYQTTIQPIETSQANMSPEAFQGFLRGNIIKYTCRIGKKDEPIKEAKKILQYAKWLVESLEGKTINPREDN